MVVLPYTDMNQPWVYICPPLYFLLKQDKSDLFWLAILYMYILNKIKGKVGFFSKHCEKVQQRFKFFFTILTVKSVILFVLCVLNYSVMLTLCDCKDWSPTVSSVHGIFPARMLERVAISFSRGSSWAPDWTRVSCIAGKVFAAVHNDLLQY